jgi:hypothetical protein
VTAVVQQAWQAADVYLHKGRLYVLSSQRDIGPGYIHAPPYFALDGSSSGHELGASVLAAVEGAADAPRADGGLFTRTMATTPWFRASESGRWTRDHPLLKMANSGRVVVLPATATVIVFVVVVVLLLLLIVWLLL